MRSAHKYYQRCAQIGQRSASQAGAAFITPTPKALLSFLYDYDETIMGDFLADEVESILYIAREISGMHSCLPHDSLMREREQYTGSRL
jgi:hypothetical protein